MGREKTERMSSLLTALEVFPHPRTRASARILRHCGHDVTRREPSAYLGSVAGPSPPLAARSPPATSCSLCRECCRSVSACPFRPARRANAICPAVRHAKSDAPASRAADASDVRHSVHHRLSHHYQSPIRNASRALRPPGCLFCPSSRVSAAKPSPHPRRLSFYRTSRESPTFPFRSPRFRLPASLLIAAPSPSFPPPTIHLFTSRGGSCWAMPSRLDPALVNPPAEHRREDGKRPPFRAR